MSRKSKYRRLREIRRERDYQSGVLQYANRPYTFPSLTILVGEVKTKQITTKKFIKNNNLEIS